MNANAIEELVKVIYSMDQRLRRIEEDIIEIKQTGTANEDKLKKLAAGQKDLAAANTEILSRMDADYLARHPNRKILFSKLEDDIHPHYESVYSERHEDEND